MKTTQRKLVLSGLKLDEQLKRRGMSQSALAARCNTSRQRINRFLLAGTHCCDIDIMHKMCMALDCKQRDLTTEIYI